MGEIELLVALQERKIMMREKRFEITEYGSDYHIEIIDNEKELDESVDNPSQKLGLVECADLLNELSEENQSLNKINKVLYDENIQLREKLLHFRNLKDDVKYLEEKGVF